jgi:hypothetical protein
MRSRCVSSPYTITTEFGWVEGYPLNKSYSTTIPKPNDGKDYGFHTGTDYISDGRILAPADSTVAGTGYDSVNGNYLILESLNHRDWFSHIKTDGFLVKTGETVKRGQHVAWQGRTGSATCVHVHHSLRKNGVMVDPELNITEEVMATDSLTKAEVIELHNAYFGGNPGSNYDYRHVTKALQTLIHDWRYSPQTLKNRIVEIQRIIAIKDNEITRLTNENESLRAQAGDTTKWQTLRALLRELLGIS